MRIVFICGSLDPGRDGVGDYTRRLAGELLRRNHQAVIVALHDRKLSEQILEGIQLDKEQSIPVLRLSSQLSWTARVNQLKRFIEAINPDWISLQYVPFSFHDKGLHVGLGKLLKRVCSGRKVQIMFHELWVGMYTQAPMRYVWWGRLQRYLIKLLVIMLKPNVVHTHTLLYQIQLNKLGIQAFLLPLFTNIPLAEGNHLNTVIPISEMSDSFKFVFFGSIHPGSPAAQLANEVAKYADKKKLRIYLTIIGRSGFEQDVWASAWRAHKLNVSILGEQSPENISRVLIQSSIGLSTTPSALAGKSGSIAAMHAHGLPVLCVSQPWQPRGIHELVTTRGISQYAIGSFESFVATYSSIDLPESNLGSVCQQFTDSLLLHSTK